MEGEHGSGPLLLRRDCCAFRAGEPSNTRLNRLPEVIQKVGLKRTAIYQRMREGRFPRSRSLGPAARSGLMPRLTNGSRRWPFPLKGSHRRDERRPISSPLSGCSALKHSSWPTGTLRRFLANRYTSLARRVYRARLPGQHGHLDFLRRGPRKQGSRGGPVPILHT